MKETIRGHGLANERSTKQALQLAAQKLLEKYRDGIRYNGRDIEGFAAGTNRSDYFYVDVYFNERLHISLSIDWHTDDAERYRDADTNDTYLCYPNGPRVRVNYPSYGAWPAGDALAVMTYYKEFCEFALQLEMALKQRTFALLETAAEEEKRWADEQAKRQQQTLQLLIEEKGKNMRVSAVRNGVEMPDVSPGAHAVDFKGKRYLVYVAVVKDGVTGSEVHMGNIQRVA